MKTLSDKRLRVCLAIHLRRARVKKRMKEHKDREWHVREALDIRSQLRGAPVPLDLQPCRDR